MEKRLGRKKQSVCIHYCKQVQQLILIREYREVEIRTDYLSVLSTELVHCRRRTGSLLRRRSVPRGAILRSRAADEQRIHTIVQYIV